MSRLVRAGLEEEEVVVVGREETRRAFLDSFVRDSVVVASREGRLRFLFLVSAGVAGTDSRSEVLSFFSFLSFLDLRSFTGESADGAIVAVL